MRICLIGPSYPFRGGIAHHTTLLYRHLRQKYQVSFYAVKRLYPRWLYPGTTDRDISASPLREAGLQYVLDSLNPFTWWKVYRSIRTDKPDLVIVPWWTSFWTLQFWIITTLLKEFTSAKILFICHNIVDHDAHPLSRLCSRLVLRQGDHFLVHSRSDEHCLQDLVPSASITRAFHPLYDYFNTGVLPTTEAKARLGLQGETILFFGFIRPYKGADDLLQAMTLIRPQRRITLLVVGEFWQGRDAFTQRLQELGIADVVKVVDQYVPNEEVGLYFSAADLVVLPYVSGTGSGIVQIAYGLDKPVVATRVGSLPEVVEDERTGFLVDPAAPRALANAIIRFFSEQRAAAFSANIRCRKDKFSWEHLVAIIEAIAVEATPEV